MTAAATTSVGGVRESGGAGGTDATLALVALTVAVAVGMGRLFTGGDHLVPLIAAAAVAHGAMWAGRRRSAPVAVSAASAVAGVALAAAWLVLPETTTYGVPGPGTLDAARTALAEAWREFGDVVAPTAPRDGFLLSAMVGVAVTAVLADWAAFRMRVLFEAVVPSFTLFVFTATLGAAEGRSVAVALYLATLLLFLVVHRAALESSGASWFASRSRGGPGALVRGAALLGTVAVVAAVVVGPRLPGASADALLAWRDADRSDGGRRTTVSPLVDIRPRLVQQSATEVFSVRSDRRAYWRLTSLDTFNGRIWSSDASYRPVGDRLPASSPAAPDEDRFVQEFAIGSLSSIWLPAAYRPTSLQGVDDASYNADLGSIITGEDSTDGLTYTVESAVPRLDAAALARARAPRTPDGMERFVQLPGVSPDVVRLARQLETDSDGTPYDVAMTIQNHFRRGFTYDLRAEAGHGEDVLEDFLFRSRTGYCEQFAGAFAVLARTVGLPTRVAVGFTPGELGPDGRYHVRGLNAHAWPEVFIGGFGWVAFEPTPGRGAPGAEGYTGVPESQARPDAPNAATTAPPTTAPPVEQPAPATTAVPGEVAAGGAGGGAADRPRWRHPLVVAVALAVLGLLVLAAAVPAAKAARRARRRSGATTPADRVWVAWTEAADAVRRAGVPRHPAETLTEHARRAGPAAALPEEAAIALATLAGDAAAASYGAGALADGTADRAARDAATVEREVTARASRRQRLQWTLDPRPLLPARRPPSPSPSPVRQPAAAPGGAGGWAEDPPG